MPIYTDTTGRTVSADMALIGGRLRPGFSKIIADGEVVQFNGFMRDAGNAGSIFLHDADAPKSIDAALALAIARAAKAEGIKPSDWLTANAGKRLELLIEATAKQFVAAAGSTGIVAHFNLDAMADNSRGTGEDWSRAVRDMARDARYQQAMPGTAITGQADGAKSTPADASGVVAAIRAARYA